MSIIFGIRKPTGVSVLEDEIIRLAHATQRYASDALVISLVGRVGMGFQPYHTHLRSKLESSPTDDAYGNLLAFDGRLDTHQELCRELSLDETSTPDSKIILAAFLRWGEECFSRFIGDWALALWSAKDQILYLARDHAGTRTLYFENRNGTLVWSTYLDSFFVDPRSIDVDEDYVACYLAAQPLRELTPYKSIRAVLPAHYVVAQDNKISSTPHWQWMSTARIRYNSDEQYDEHFLDLFGQSVERRDGPGEPIAAQLSGGMDSTSIVCMSDHKRRSRYRSADLIDTISFYDDSESNWNEKPYFSAVETKRGKTGVHIQVSSMDRTFEPHDPSEGIYLLPGADSSAIERELKIQAAIGAKGYRIILSGVGGDEVLGGVPSPKPELADYLVAGNLRLLLKRTIDWCIPDKSPFFQTLGDTVKYACELYRQPHIDRKSMPPWIKGHLQRACAKRMERGLAGVRRQSLSPSSISNGLAWWSIMETLPHIYPGILTRFEYRYPFLDRQLVDYLFSIPPEQLQRPGRRRFLMRRALKNIVPEEILERRRKGYQLRGPLSAMQQSHRKIDLLFANASISDRGFIDPTILRSALDLTDKGMDIRWWRTLTRAIALELWLKQRQTSQIVDHAISNNHQILLSNTGANKIRTIRVVG